MKSLYEMKVAESSVANPEMGENGFFFAGVFASGEPSNRFSFDCSKLIFPSVIPMKSVKI